MLMGKILNKEEVLKKIFYFEMAADKGNINAMYELGFDLSNLKEIENDYEKAAEYYKQAAYLGDSESMLNLGIMLKDGRLPVDLKESEKYLKMAIELDNDKAMYTLANMYIDKSKEAEFDDEIDEYLEKAKKLFKKAADLGNYEASFLYRKLVANTFDDISFAEDRDPFSNPFFSMNFRPRTFLEELLFIYSHSKPFYDLYHDSDDDDDYLYQRQRRNIFNFESNNKRKIEIIKSLNEVKPNTYESFAFDTNNFHFCLSNSTISIELRDRIKQKLSSLKEFKEVKTNICYPEDPNNLYTIFYFSNRVFIEPLINEILTNKINLRDQNYLFFDEQMFPKEKLPLLLEHLRVTKGVERIERNVFFDNQICTYLIVKPYSQNNIIQNIRDLLLQKDIIFNSSKYQLENNIIINEKMILNDDLDFNAIVEEIKTKNIKTTSIQRKKLYLYNHSKSKLFQLFSFICFRNEKDKMRAINHINKIVFKGKNNVLKYNKELHYASINVFMYPKNIRDLIPSIFDSIEGVKDVQSLKVSIDCPIEKTYVGFDTLENMKKGYHKFMYLLNIYLNCKEPKIFVKKNDVNYYFVIEVNHNKIIDDLIKELANSADDFQDYCTEYLYGGNIRNATYLGFKLFGDLIDVENKFKSDVNVKKENVYSTIFNEGKTFMRFSTDVKESYLFYDNL